jgi:hypothetical protein
MDGSCGCELIGVGPGGAATTSNVSLAMVASFVAALAGCGRGLSDAFHRRAREFIIGPVMVSF